MNVRLVGKLILCVSLLGLNACSSLNESVSETVRDYFGSSDSGEKPAELAKFTSTLNVTEGWSANIGSDAKNCMYDYNRLLTGIVFMRQASKVRSLHMM